jgi:hypothetical protein
MSSRPHITPPPPTLTTWRRTHLLPHDVETTICCQTLLKLKISAKIIHHILSHDTHRTIPYKKGSKIAILRDEMTRAEGLWWSIPPQPRPDVVPMARLRAPSLSSRKTVLHDHPPHHSPPP